MINVVVNNMSGWHYLAVFVVVGLIAGALFCVAARAMMSDD